MQINITQLQLGDLIDYLKEVDEMDTLRIKITGIQATLEKLQEAFINNID